MKRLAGILAVPTIICFVILMLWGEAIREFSGILYLLLFLLVGVGYVSILIQNNRDRDRAIADKAIAEYKKSNGITD